MAAASAHEGVVPSLAYLAACRVSQVLIVHGYAFAAKRVDPCKLVDTLLNNNRGRLVERLREIVTAVQPSATLSTVATLPDACLELISEALLAETPSSRDALGTAHFLLSSLAIAKSPLSCISRVLQGAFRQAPWLLPCILACNDRFCHVHLHGDRLALVDASDFAATRTSEQYLDQVVPLLLAQTQLQTLSIDAFGPCDLSALASLTSLRTLRSLSLANCSAIATSNFVRDHLVGLTTLQALHVSGIDRGDDALRNLSALTDLHSLVIEDCDELRTLPFAALTALSHLEHLRVYAPSFILHSSFPQMFGEDFLVSVAPTLTSLSLDHSRLVMRPVRVPLCFPRLHTLHLGNADASFVRLCRHHYLSLGRVLPSLRNLYISREWLNFALFESCPLERVLVADASTCTTWPFLHAFISFIPSTVTKAHLGRINTERDKDRLADYFLTDPRMRSVLELHSGPLPAELWRCEAFSLGLP